MAQQDGEFYAELCAAGLKEQVLAVLSQQDCDCGPEFLGFSDIYRHLAAIIPLDWAVLDFGCAFAFQSYYFRNHREYVGIGPGDYNTFSMPNSTFFKMTTGQYLKEATRPTGPVFAICSYVPPWYGEESHKLVRENFEDVFTYYPKYSGNYWDQLLKNS